MTTRFRPVDVLRAQAAARGTQTALTCGNQAVTFAELEIRVNRVANALRGDGVDFGDRVVLVCRNNIEFFEVFFGCASIGAVAAPLSWRLTATDIKELVDNAGAQIVVVDEEFCGLIPTEARQLIIGSSYEPWRDRASPAKQEHVAERDDDVIQFYTSGTTGLPKGVIVRNSNLAQLARAGARWRIGNEAVVIALMPLFHMGGSAWALVALLQGAHCVIVADFDALMLFDIIEFHRATNMLVAPAMLQMMVDVPGAAARKTSSLRSIVYGSAPISAPLLRATIDTLDAPLIQLFGLTETTGAVVQLDPEHHHGERLRSVGRPYPWVEVSIRTASGGQVAGPNSQGEIWIRSGQCTSGYWRAPEETAKLITTDGWLRTGDAGYVDADGFVFITDRIKDLIITGGENVSPAEVERVLVEHPSIAEVAVFGVPDRKWGEAIAAVVVLRAGSSLTSVELDAWAHARLAGFRRPRRITFVAALPRNAAGKILRRELGALIDQ